MSNSEITIKYTSQITKNLIGQKLYYENIGGIKNKCQVIFWDTKTLLVYFEYIDFESNKSVQKECLYGLLESIACILSWKYNLPITNIKTKRGNPYNIKSRNNTYVVDNKYYKNVLLGLYTGKTPDILEAYREIKNEQNEQLRFLMCYRLLEILSKKDNKSVGSFINYFFPYIQKVKIKRSNKETNIISYTRNKIHATNNEYLFPYKQLSHELKIIDKVLRITIKKEIQKYI